MMITTTNAATLARRSHAAHRQRDPAGYRQRQRAAGQRGYRATISVLERPGAGAITYDRKAWLLWKLGYTPRQQSAAAPD